MIKGILWDNDGVLVDTEKLFFKANQDLFKEHRITLTEQQFFEWYLVKNHGAWHLLTDQSADDIIQLRNYRDALYTDYLLTNTQLEIAGMQHLVHQLSEHIPMGIVTSSKRHHFEMIHARTNFLPYFKFVITEDMVATSKPSPEPYLLGLKHLGIDAKDALVIEDSPRGLQAAISAGIKCIVLRHSLMRDFAFDGAYRVANSVEELRREVFELIK